MHGLLAACVVSGVLCVSAPEGSVIAGDPAPFMRGVIDRCRAALLATEPAEDADALAAHAAALSGGRWPNIAYDDQGPNNWRPAGHLARVKDLALAYSLPGHPLHGDESLVPVILDALDYWLGHRHTATNWWWNEIGVPMRMRDILVLAEDRLDPAQRAGALEVIAQHQVRGTGANLIWGAALSIHHGAFTGDADTMAASAARLWEEVVMGADEGIQSDWSFYQHGARLQTFHYGRAFVSIVVDLAWQLHDTPWAIPPEKRALISNTLLEGMQWMARGPRTVPGTMDRQVSRKKSLGLADMSRELALWRNVDPDRRADLDAYLGHITENTAPVGFRHFPIGDFTAHHRPGFSFFMKTLSNRTHLTETINAENLRGQPYLGTGDHWLLRDGTPFDDTQPVWMWDHLPGVSMADDATVPARTAFSGGAGNGASGLVAVDYRRSDEDGNPCLAMRKLTACHGDIVLHLMGGITVAGAGSRVSTAMEQRPLDGPVWAATGDTAPRELPEGSHDLKQVRWLWHHGVANVPLEPSTVSVRAETFEGSWRDINHSYEADETVRAPFLLAVLEHDAPGTAGYAILPRTNPTDADQIAADPPWEVFRNDAAAQAIVFDDGTHMAAFYEPGAVDTPVPLEVSAPCVVLWDNETLWIADPTHAGVAVDLKWLGTRHSITLPDNGFTAGIVTANASPASINRLRGAPEGTG